MDDRRMGEHPDGGIADMTHHVTHVGSSTLRCFEESRSVSCYDSCTIALDRHYQTSRSESSVVHSAWIAENASLAFGTKVERAGLGAQELMHAVDFRKLHLTHLVHCLMPLMGRCTRNRLEKGGLVQQGFAQVL
eukprot:2974387-Amphidinium_carterae.1